MLRALIRLVYRIRLTEGFNFAYSAAGITNMVLEVQMQCFGDNKESYPCIIQYILFPPHAVSNTTLERDSGSEEDTEEGRILSVTVYILVKRTGLFIKREMDVFRYRRRRSEYAG